MKSSFNKLILIILAVSIFLPLTGCGKKPIDNNIKEIEFWTLQLTGFSEYINEIIDEYERLHPDVRIKWIDVPFAEGEKRALAAVLSDNVPDLINMNPDFGATLASKGALTDIKSLISEKNYDNYLLAAWEASSIDEKVFGFPWYITSAVTFYNTEILSQAGVTGIPKTYDDLEKIAPKIKTNTGKYTLMPTLTEGGKMLKFFHKYGIPITQEAKFNTPEAVDILNFWKNFYDNEYIPAESITQGHREALGKFQAGETAFIVAGANFAKIIKENAPQIYNKLGVSSQLTGDTGQADFSLMNLVIPKKSRRPEIALNFALFLTNENNILKFCRLAPILPPNRHALNNEFFTQKTTDDLIVKSRIISASQLTNPLPPLPQLKNRKDLYEIIDFMTQEVMLGQKTPEEALTDSVIKWNLINNR